MARGAAAGHAYDLGIPLPAGTYTVRVLHHDQGAGGASSRDVARAQATVTRN